MLGWFAVCAIGGVRWLLVVYAFREAIDDAAPDLLREHRIGSPFTSWNQQRMLQLAADAQVTSSRPLAESAHEFVRAWRSFTLVVVSGFIAGGALIVILD